jgi:hypothetical protein
VPNEGEIISLGGDDDSESASEAMKGKKFFLHHSQEMMRFSSGFKMIPLCFNYQKIQLFSCVC